MIHKNGREGYQWQDRVVVAVRVILGSIFLLHGWQKLFGYGLSSVTAEFTKLHFPAPFLSSIVVTVVELLGGVALVSGLFSRWAAGVLAFEMIIALVAVHLRQGFLLGFFWPGGSEYILTLFAISISLVIMGTGALGLTSVFRERLDPHDRRRDSST
jgi:putative oxidoreductase